jgi:hypothetical protein
MLAAAHYFWLQPQEDGSKQQVLVAFSKWTIFVRHTGVLRSSAIFRTRT